VRIAAAIAHQPTSMKDVLSELAADLCFRSWMDSRDASGPLGGNPPDCVGDMDSDLP